MKLDIDFSKLTNVREKMGAPLLRSFTSVVTTTTLADLKAGKEVEPEEILIGAHDQLIHKETNQVILLYIKDVGSVSQKSKFHISNCSTIHSFLSGGNIERYVGVVRDKHSLQPDYFELKLGYGYKKSVKLEVCKNCLRKMDYHGYSRFNNYPVKKDKIYYEFDLIEFFEEYKKFNPIYKELNKINELIKSGESSGNDLSRGNEIKEVIYKRLDNFRESHKALKIESRDVLFRDISRFHSSNKEQLKNAEFLRSVFRNHVDITDYSTLVVQYSRILEIEFQYKITRPLIDYARNQYSSIDYSDDKYNQDSKSLYWKVSKDDHKATFGELFHFMRCVNQNKEGSLFRIMREYFDDRLFDEKFLSKMKKYKDDFRNNAAHTGFISAFDARSCELLMKSILQDLFELYDRKEDRKVSANVNYKPNLQE